MKETRYDIAIQEFQSENDDGKHRLVYAYFGLAIYFSQCLEETFSIMLWTNRIFKNKVKSNKEVNEIIDVIENSKKTMGNLLNEVKRNYSLTDKQINALYDILEKRNYLTHKYFKLEIQKFYSETGKKEMLKYFCDFIDQSKLIDEELKLHYSAYTTKLGLTEEKLNEMMDEMKSQELERTKT